MARDDYHVIVYQILAYLYVCLKKGEPVDGTQLLPDSKMLNINETYWAYIFENMYSAGLIEGVTVTKAWGGKTAINDLDYCRITPAGIEYVSDNSFMEKAKEFLKDIKAIVPFV